MDMYPGMSAHEAIGQFDHNNEFMQILRIRGVYTYEQITVDIKSLVPHNQEFVLYPDLEQPNVHFFNTVVFRQLRDCGVNHIILNRDNFLELYHTPLSQGESLRDHIEELIHDELQASNSWPAWHDFTKYKFVTLSNPEKKDFNNY